MVLTLGKMFLRAAEQLSTGGLLATAKGSNIGIMEAFLRAVPSSPCQESFQYLPPVMAQVLFLRIQSTGLEFCQLDLLNPALERVFKP